MRGTSILVLALLIGLLATLAIVIVIVLAIRRRRAVPHPSCGQCRYAVAGLETMTCPECGADLRTVGILTPGVLGATWLVPVLLALLWTLLAFVVGSVAATVAHRAYPRPFQTNSTWTMTTTRTNFDPVTLAFRGIARLPNGPFDTVTLTTPPRDGVTRAPLAVTLPDLSVEGDADRSLTPAVITDWLRRDREVREPADLERAGAELFDHVKTGRVAAALTVTDPSIYVGANISSQSFQQPWPRWFTSLVIGTWVAIWLIGLWLIIWRARRRRRLVNASPRTSP